MVHEISDRPFDLCLKLRARGWRIRYEPTSVLTHHESASGPERFSATDKNVERLQAAWAATAVGDLVLENGETRLNPAGILAGAAISEVPPR